MRSENRLASFLLLAAALAGCQAAPRTATPVAVKAGDAVSFWEELPRAKVVSRADALRALAEFGAIPGADTADHAAHVQALKDKGWLAADAKAAPDAPATRGEIAAILCPLLKIRGGLSMRIDSFWGVRERYATRELAGLGILPTGSLPSQTISGIDLTRTLAFAAHHQETHP